jgi:hypothetical protein
MSNKTSEEQQKLESAHEEESVIKFPASAPQTEEEILLTRIKAEAQRLAGQPEVERLFWMPKRAEILGVQVSVLKAAVKEITDAQEKAEAEEQAKNELHEKQRTDAERAVQDEEKRKRDEKKEADRERKKAEKEAERERKKEEQEERKRRAAFGAVAKLPIAKHDKELQKLATKFDADLDELRAEFRDYLGVDATGVIEPWPEPVELAALLAELANKVGRYVVVSPIGMTAGVLWVAHCWLYDHGIPTHSPVLASTSADWGSGKSTFLVALCFATPRLRLNTNVTGPALYRTADRIKPTFVIDNADELFVGKSDLRTVIEASWIKGFTIPRLVGGIEYPFDAFCPKAISLLEKNLPSGAFRSRCIVVRLLPKKEEEKVEDFRFCDDEEFAVLRQKFARWAQDHAAELKDAKPIIPSALHNRPATNWKLQLAIAELAGGSWPEQAREAAVRLTRDRYQPSYGQQLLAECRSIREGGRKEILSKDLMVYLHRDPTSIWVEFNRGGSITQRQIARLLRDYELFPEDIGPLRLRGYKFDSEAFTDAFARYLPNDPLILSSRSKHRKKTKRSKSKRTKVKRSKPKSRR